MQARTPRDKRLAYPDHAPIGSMDSPLATIRTRYANRPADTVDYAPEFHSLTRFYDLEELRQVHADLLLDLRAYRTRYYANLKYRYGKGELIDSFGAHGHTIWNYAASTTLDQWAIDSCLANIKHIERLAKRQGESI